ncbi:MAG: VCBS repeat-containing protein [Bacteroidetes bacterium]|nr:VCBS repeat-containing protein [Bacteroidota bacterium]
MTFKDITDQANVSANNSWCSGVTMVDINNDGFMDIYVTRAFYPNPKLRENLLYINQGDLTFKEQAEEYGINDSNYGNQSTFFDYDLDGDLDLFIGNYPLHFADTRKEQLESWNEPNLNESDKLYRNNGDGTFQDVTRESGILNHGWTLGIIASDLNGDGYPDIYVTVDHDEPDHLYMNNGDGTFHDAIHESMKHISNFSMGIDIADINNDGLQDIFIADMMAEDNYRQKTQMSGMNPKRFWEFVDMGYHYQYMRNVLQLNNGNGTFSEIGQLAGLDKTDWSWSTLFSDYNNDGFIDLFVANGYRFDVRDNDFLKKINEKFEGEDNPVDIQEFLKMSTATRLHNYMFINNGEYMFSDISSTDGFDLSSFSNGAAYGDLDNDGDLDIVVNNIIDPAFIYQNNSRDINGHAYLIVKLKGPDKNVLGLGSVVTVETANMKLVKEHTLTRGFQSSVDNIIHFGLGDQKLIDRLIVQWPDGMITTIDDVEVNQNILVEYKDVRQPIIEENNVSMLFTELESVEGIDFEHQENEYDDYKYEILLPHRTSRFGPSIAVGDVNGDGLEDFYIGGAAKQAGKLYLQNDKWLSFSEVSNEVWLKDKLHEDIGAHLFDADGDGDLDLYVVSGGNSVDPGSIFLQDRLYENDGVGNFSRATAKLPPLFTSGSCVTSADYDGDGDLDLFVGGRLVPGKYPFPANSYILNNKGNGVFVDVTADVAADLLGSGLVTSAVWSDYNNDGQLDLLVVGEWMSPMIFINNGNTFENRTADLGFEERTGWWNRIVQTDLDMDGRMDYVCGNLGLNYKYRVTEKEPLHVYCHDFDSSGTFDIVLGYYNGGECYPVRGRQCSSEQIPMIKEKFGNYHQFGKATISDVYGEDLNDALHYMAKYFSSAYFMNSSNGSTMTQLPIEAQFSTIFDIIPEDFNGDGKTDLLIAGNFHVSEVETGRADAGTGLLLKGDGKGNFEIVNLLKSGFFADRDVRDLAMLKDNKGNKVIIVANNNDKPQFFQVNNLPGIELTVR